MSSDNTTWTDTSARRIEAIDTILEMLARDTSIVSKTDFQKLANSVYQTHQLSRPPASIAFIERYAQMLEDGRIQPSPRVEKILRKRAVRNLSGIAVISLLTKFWGCPGKCVYCPTFPGLPKSYIPNEPAVMRAELNAFDPVRQVQNRLRSLRITGHTIDKCDVRIIGGTWSVYPHEYQEAFIQDIYDAHTTYPQLEPFIEKTSTSSDRFAQFKVRAGYQMHRSKSLAEAKQRNETATSRVIGMQIETRPDWVTIEEIIRLRGYGVTRVEIGYQTTIDEINELNKRGHGNAESIQATRLLKDAGFKICAHIMPNLLGSTPELDRVSLRQVFENSDFRPDELKIYPMVVTDRSELTKIWKEGGFQAYDDETLIELMVDLYAMIPPYVRLNRMYRDIPSTEILHGSHLANLRQIVEERMHARGLRCMDTSSREIRGKPRDPKIAQLVERTYEASGGIEHMLSFEDPEDDTLFALLRLRIPSQYFSKEKHFLPVLQDSALIREMHTYGEQLGIGDTPLASDTQHQGLGKRLLQEAERIVREKYPKCTRIAVIAGVGVREYFRKQGYQLEDEYMVKVVK